MIEYGWFTDEQREINRIQKLILKEVYNLSSRPVFKGGTALEMIYGLDRFSEDLDFDVDTDDVLVIDHAIENLDSKIIAVENDWGSEIIRHSNMYVYVLNFYSELLAKRVTIKIDAVLDKCMLPPKKRIMEIAGNAVTVAAMDEKEILAEKINAIMSERRNQPRDLYDLKFLLEKNTPIDMHMVYLKSQNRLFGEPRKYSITVFSERVHMLEDKWDALKPYLNKLPDFNSTANYVIDKLKLVS